MVHDSRALEFLTCHPGQRSCCRKDKRKTGDEKKRRPYDLGAYGTVLHRVLLHADARESEGVVNGELKQTR